MEQRTTTSKSVLPLPLEPRKSGGAAIQHSPSRTSEFPVTQASYNPNIAVKRLVPYLQANTYHDNSLTWSDGRGDSSPDDHSEPADTGTHGWVDSSPDRHRRIPALRSTLVL